MTAYSRVALTVDLFLPGVARPGAGLGLLESAGTGAGILKGCVAATAVFRSGIVSLVETLGARDLSGPASRAAVFGAGIVESAFAGFDVFPAVVA